MARKVFFSFHYQRDIFRVNVIRNAWVCEGVQESGFWDASLWERTRTRGDAALQRLIAEGLEGTTVTAVLIGAETWLRPWVHYEIQESRRRGNGLIGIRIHQVRSMVPGRYGQVLGGGVADTSGLNPFNQHWNFEGYRTWYDTLLSPPRTPGDCSISSLVPIYDWVGDDGYANIGSWVESAANRGWLTRLWW